MTRHQTQARDGHRQHLIQRYGDRWDGSPNATVTDTNLIWQVVAKEKPVSGRKLRRVHILDSLLQGPTILCGRHV